MSLINEALKRTRDASYQTAVAPSSVAPSYQNQANVESRGSKSGLIATIVVAVIAIVGVSVVGLRVARGIQKLKDGFAPNAGVTTETANQPEPLAHPASTPVTPPKVEAPAPKQPPAVSATAQTTSAPGGSPKTAEDELVGRLIEKIKAEQAATAPKPPPPAELPKLVLQGITFAADGNEVMINGVSLRQGEDIEGARITTIERRAVRLDFGGREIVLRLP